MFLTTFRLSNVKETSQILRSKIIVERFVERNSPFFDIGVRLITNI